MVELPVPLEEDQEDQKSLTQILTPCKTNESIESTKGQKKAMTINEKKIKISVKIFIRYLSRIKVFTLSKKPKIFPLDFLYSKGIK